MGKMTEQEKIAIGIIAIVFSPFIILGRVIRSIGESLGIIEPEKYDYDPKLNTHYVAPESQATGEQANLSGNNSQSSDSNVTKPQIGQGFDNPNRLDPNS